jgi:hypothetical protein
MTHTVPENYFIQFSGGKDKVLKEKAKEALDASFLTCALLLFSKKHFF